jgi:hypothetical protein
MEGLALLTMVPFLVSWVVLMGGIVSKRGKENGINNDVI